MYSSESPDYQAITSTGFHRGRKNSPSVYVASMNLIFISENDVDPRPTTINADGGQLSNSANVYLHFSMEGNCFILPTTPNPTPVDLFDVLHRLEQDELLTPNFTMKVQVITGMGYLWLYISHFPLM